MGAGQGTKLSRGEPVQGAEEMSPLETLLLSDVAEPWQALLSKARLVKEQLKFALGTAQPLQGKFPAFSADERTEGDREEDVWLTLDRAREEIQTLSWYILLDLAKFLENYLPDVWNVLLGNVPATSLDSIQKQMLVV